MIFKYLLLSLFTLVLSENVSSDEIDHVINLLLNNDSFEVESGEISDVKENEITFSEGMWKCGECSKLNSTNVMLMETYDVDTNYEDDDFKVELGLAFSNMRCVTVSGTDISQLSVQSGSCTGDSVTLSASGASHFDIIVY